MSQRFLKLCFLFSQEIVSTLRRCLVEQQWRTRGHVRRCAVLHFILQALLVNVLSKVGWNGGCGQPKALRHRLSPGLLWGQTSIQRVVRANAMRILNPLPQFPPVYKSTLVRIKGLHDHVGVLAREGKVLPLGHFHYHVSKFLTV